MNADDLVERQIENEEYYSRKHINTYIDEAIREDINSELKVQSGIILMKHWLKQKYYEGKQQRLAQLDPLSLEQLVREIFTTIAYYQKPELFVSVTGQLARKLGFGDHRDSIVTVAEIVGVLCQTDAFDIMKNSDAVDAQLVIVNQLELPTELVEQMNRSMYLPPMVCPPEEIRSNYESGYLTHNDSIMLGQNNSHDGDLCLDVINLQNSVEYKLDFDFIDNVPEKPNHELDTMDKHTHWYDFMQQSDDIYELMRKTGGNFWLTHKPDKRGRFYSQGYHVTTQGTPYKKASIELAKQEIVTGVPS